MIKRMHWDRQSTTNRDSNKEEDDMRFLKTNRRMCHGVGGQI